MNNRRFNRRPADVDYVFLSATPVLAKRKMAMAAIAAQRG